MKQFNRNFVGVLLVCLMLGLVMRLAAQDTSSMMEPVVSVQRLVWGDLSEVEGSNATLTRMEHGLSVSIETSGLEPANAYTVWWVIFNTPQNCTDDMCGFDDVFLMDEGQFILGDNGLRQFNSEGIDAAQISVLRASGFIPFADGTTVVRAHLPIGDTTDSVVFGPGLLNPMGADVHFIVYSHGAAQPEILTDQLFTLGGGCPPFTPPCEDQQFARFSAPPAP